jgi:hypothetical protein
MCKIVEKISDSGAGAYQIAGVFDTRDGNSAEIIFSREPMGSNYV